MALFSKKPELDQIRIVNETPRPQLDQPRAANGRYGIAEAIQLMRSVPVEQNVELVVAVIRNTLESLNVHLADIIEDGSQKERSLQQRIETLKTEIAEHERQIDTRSQEIGRLHGELAETITAKERLIMAQQGAGFPVPTPPGRRDTGAPPVPPQLKVATTPPGAPPPSPRAIQALQAVQDDIKIT
jgi:hypothetical protein